VHRRLDLAYTTLMDAAKRKEYDLELFPDGVPAPPPPPAAPVAELPPRSQTKTEEVVAAAARPPMPDLGPRTEYSGAMLRQIREALGVELREIAERSKIGMGYLVALEAEAFAKLPAPVYVRGFLAEYARMLGLDSERVKDTYLERYRAARGMAEPDEKDRDKDRDRGDDPPSERRKRGDDTPSERRKVRE
jgi:flagellar biosynthesis protein FlhG